MTPAQIKLLRTAVHKLGIDDADYRTILRSIAGVKSCKQLTNESLEDVMAFLEERGFPGHYWTDKVQRRITGQVTDRQLRMIESLATQIPYPLASMVYRLSNHRTNRPEDLDAREAYNLIEACKKIVDRGTGERGTGVPPVVSPSAPLTNQPSLFPQDVPAGAAAPVSHYNRPPASAAACLATEEPMTDADIPF